MPVPLDLAETVKVKSDTLKTWPGFQAVLRMGKSFKCSRIIFQSRLKLIFFDLIFIEKCLFYGAWRG